MKVATFKEHNLVIAKDQPEYQSLPVYKFPDDPQGAVICCWELSIKERIKLLFAGKIWHQILTFNSSLQPQNLSVDNPFK